MSCDSPDNFPLVSTALAKQNEVCVQWSMKTEHLKSFQVETFFLVDIVFVRTWFQVQIPTFYNPVSTLLLPHDQKNQWQGMKTLGQLRREKNIKAEFKSDSLYRVRRHTGSSSPFYFRKRKQTKRTVALVLLTCVMWMLQAIERKARPVKPLVIPKELQKNLPFKDKPKVVKEVKDKVQRGRIAVVREPKERKVRLNECVVSLGCFFNAWRFLCLSVLVGQLPQDIGCSVALTAGFFSTPQIADLMKMMKELHAHKLKQRRILMRQRAAQHEKEEAKVATKRELKHKEIKKQIYRALGKAEKRKKVR